MGLAGVSCRFGAAEDQRWWILPELAMNENPRHWPWEVIDAPIDVQLSAHDIVQPDLHHFVGRARESRRSLVMVAAAMVPTRRKSSAQL